MVNLSLPVSKDNLEQCDCLVGGSKSDYKEIAVISGIDIDFFVENAIIRGGCFWSDRKNIPIPGIIRGGKIIRSEVFISLLKNNYDVSKNRKINRH